MKSTETRYFVMLVDGARGAPLPMVEDHETGRVALFNSEDAAERAGEANPLGAAFGYEVYPWAHEPTQ